VGFFSVRHTNHHLSSSGHHPGEPGSTSLPAVFFLRLFRSRIFEDKWHWFLTRWTTYLSLNQQCQNTQGVSWSLTSLFSTNMAISETNGQFIEDTIESSVFLPRIISLVIMCIGIIWNHSFFSRRTRPGRSLATANVTLYCTWRPSGLTPSGLTIGLHEQGKHSRKYKAMT